MEKTTKQVRSVTTKQQYNNVYPVKSITLTGDTDNFDISRDKYNHITIDIKKGGSGEQPDLTEIQEQIDALDTRQTSLETSYTVLQRTVANVTQTATNNSSRLYQLETNFERLETKLNNLQTIVDSFLENVVQIAYLYPLSDITIETNLEEQTITFVGGSFYYLTIADGNTGVKTFSGETIGYESGRVLVLDHETLNLSVKQAVERDQTEYIIGNMYTEEINGVIEEKFILNGLNNYTIT